MRERRSRLWWGAVLRAATGLTLLAAGAAVLVGFIPSLVPVAAAAPCDATHDLCLMVTTTNDAAAVSLPLGGTVAVSVDWGDGTSDTFTSSGDTSPHVYSSVGSYEVVIAPDTAASPAGPWLTHFGDAAGYTGADLITSVVSFGDLGITSLSGAFDHASQLSAVPGSLPSGVTDLSAAFEGATSFNQSLDGWDTSAVTNMANTFNGAAGFDADISGWDTHNVTTMADMFNDAVAFDQPLGGWDTASVTTMNGMFANADAFDEPIGAWDTHAVTDMGGMFAGASAFDQPLGAWNTAAVTSMNDMFDGAYAFDEPLGTWDTRAVTDLSGMFTDATSFDQPIGGWQTGAVTDMAATFSGAAAFDQPLDTWNTAAVTTMANMFDGAVSFDQPIGAWNVAATTDMTGMFADGAGLSLANYDALLNGWAAEALHPAVAFDAGTAEYNGLARYAHDTVLIGADGWTISDGGFTSAPIPSQITASPVASGIVYGQRLGTARLTGGTADTPGTFTFVAPAQLLDAGVAHVAVRFTPTSAYYAPVTLEVPVVVAKARATLGLSGLVPVRRGRTLRITVRRLVAGARLTVVWRTGRHVFARTLTAPATTVRLALVFRVPGTYRIVASASDPNVSFGVATGSVRAR